MTSRRTDGGKNHNKRDPHLDCGQSHEHCQRAHRSPPARGAQIGQLLQQRDDQEVDVGQLRELLQQKLGKKCEAVVAGQVLGVGTTSGLVGPGRRRRHVLRGSIDLDRSERHGLVPALACHLG